MLEVLLEFFVKKSQLILIIHKYKQNYRQLNCSFEKTDRAY